MVRRDHVLHVCAFRLPTVAATASAAAALAQLTRSSLLPDVPTVAETIPGYKRDGSHVMLAPAGTPRAVLDKISNEVRRIFELPDVQQRMANFDYLLAPTTPAEMDAVLRADIETFAEVIRLAGLRPK
jgi:tripartite-type tricarboxylate transporter receptor subunit TctC